MSSGLPAHVEESDLISYGLVGLISAIERFDLEREIKFETYAITRIKGSIIDELRSLDWVPRSISRARARTERGTQSSERSSSMIDPLMRVMANVSNLISRPGSKRSIAEISPSSP